MGFYRHKPPPGAMLDRSHPFCKDLVGYWLFNEGGGSIVHDLSGFGHNLVFASGLTAANDWVPSELGAAIDFDGTRDYLSGPDFDKLVPSATQPITVIALAKSNGLPAVRDGIVTAQDSGLNGMDLRLENTTNPAVGLVFSVGSWNLDAAYVASSAFDASAMNSYAGRFDGATLDAFVNGIKGTSDTSTGAGSYTNRVLYVGTNFDTDFNRDFSGKIVSASVHIRALSDAEILEHAVRPFAHLWHPSRRLVPAAAAGGTILPQMLQHGLHTGAPA